MSSPATASVDSAPLARAIASLAASASVELTWHDTAKLASCRSTLPPRTRVFVSFVPGQTWSQTLDACIEVRRAGFDPVPHIPARELASEGALENIASQLRLRPAVRQVLLIAGDRVSPAGPFASSLDALRSGALQRNGIIDIAVAAHPEGHPRIADAELRRAEKEKAELARASGLRLTYVTQFFFEADPFLAWARQMRAEGIDAPLAAGIAGPASVATLAKFALRCGVGASMRAIGARPGLATQLVGERDPGRLMRDVAQATLAGNLGAVGLHFYSFGGLERTCAWLASAEGGNCRRPTAAP